MLDALRFMAHDEPDGYEGLPADLFELRNALL